MATQAELWAAHEEASIKLTHMFYARDYDAFNEYRHVVIELFDRAKSLEYVMQHMDITYSTARAYHQKWRKSVEKDAIIKHLEQKVQKLEKEVERLKNELTKII